eukprot:165536_1
MAPVDFIYEGLLCRIRPDLDEFMEYVVDHFDVVLYTTANKDMYGGLLSMLHKHLKQALGRDDDDDCILWNDVLYRDDCTAYNGVDEKVHNYKDLTLFGCHLSRCVMVDNSESVCCGLEPNFIFIEDYLGRDDGDDELMELYQYLDVIASIKGDIRYFLCGLLQDDEDEKTDSNDGSECFECVEYKDECLDLSTARKCLNVTNKLMIKLKEVYREQLNDYEKQMKNESLPLSTLPIDLGVVEKEKRLLQTQKHKMKAFVISFAPQLRYADSDIILTILLLYVVIFH